MRRSLFPILFLLTALMPAGAAAAAPLTVEFTGTAPGGQVVIAVFSDAAAWRARTPARATRIAPTPGVTAVAAFDLPPGQYGLMAYADRNRNGVLDTLPIGLPTEAYGFSNNARGVFGPPEWRKAVFTLPSDGARQTIALH